MGTLADKLSYVNETKQQIKSAIVNKGVAVADTDTFRSYANKIASIVVSKTQTKNVTLTSASATTITPDSSYTGLDKVVVTPATQTKNVTLTSASATTITPDSGNVGLTSVTVTPQRQEKSISVTANQTYTATPDANYVGLSKVTVTPAVEARTANITGNGSTTVYASGGKVGMTSVTINTNVVPTISTQYVIAYQEQWGPGEHIIGRTFALPAWYSRGRLILQLHQANANTIQSVSVSGPNCNISKIEQSGTIGCA